MTQPAKRTLVANAFGAFGYLSVFFQWIWSLLLLAYPLLESNPELLFPQPTTISKPALEITPGLTPLLTFVAILITALILIATIIVIARMPKTLGQRASQVTKSAATAIIPVVSHHKKVTKKERQRLSYRIILLIKLLVVILPLVLLLFVRPIQQLDSAAIWAIASFAATCSLFYFAIQLTITHIGHIKRSDVW